MSSDQKPGELFEGLEQYVRDLHQNQAQMQIYKAVSGLLEGQTGIGEELFRSIDRLKNDADRLRQRMEEEK